MKHVFLFRGCDGLYDSPLEILVNGTGDGTMAIRAICRDCASRTDQDLYPGKMCAKHKLGVRDGNGCTDWEPKT